MKNTDKVTMEIRRIYLNIRTDWNLTGSIIKDFISVTLREFKYNNNITSDQANKSFDDFSEYLLNKIYEGMNHHLGKFGVHHLNKILESYIKQAIDEEVLLRLGENGSIDQENRSNRKHSINIEMGGMIYIQ